MPFFSTFMMLQLQGSHRFDSAQSDSALQQMERRALGAIDPNAADAAAGSLTADVAQVCPARLRSFLS